MKRRDFLTKGCMLASGIALLQGCGDKSTTPQFPVSVAKSACTGCGACLDVCPHQAISLVEAIAQIDQNLCTKCLTCVPECAYNAIIFSGY